MAGCVQPCVGQTRLFRSGCNRCDVVLGFCCHPTETNKTTRLNCLDPRTQFNYLPKKNSRVLCFMAELTTQPMGAGQSSELCNEAALEAKVHCCLAPGEAEMCHLGRGFWMSTAGLHRSAKGSIQTGISFLYCGHTLANTESVTSPWLKKVPGSCMKFRQDSSQGSSPDQVEALHALKSSNRLTLVSRPC